MLMYRAMACRKANSSYINLNKLNYEKLLTRRRVEYN